MPPKKRARKEGLVPWNDGDRLMLLSWLLDQDQLKPHRANVKIADWERLAANAPPGSALAGRGGNLLRTQVSQVVNKYAEQFRAAAEAAELQALSMSPHHRVPASSGCGARSRHPLLAHPGKV